MRFKQNHEYFALAEVLTVVVLFLTVSTALGQGKKNEKIRFFYLREDRLRVETLGM